MWCRCSSELGNTKAVHAVLFRGPVDNAPSLGESVWEHQTVGELVGWLEAQCKSLLLPLGGAPPFLCGLPG